MSSILLLLLVTGCGGGDVEIDGPAGGGEGLFGGPSGSGSETTFQIGDKWGAYQVTSQGLSNLNNFVYSQLATNMVKINTTFSSGSGFYLGQYEGEHLIGTSAHIFKKIPSCSILPVVITFSLAKEKYYCDKVIGAWRDVDFAIISLKKRDQDEDTDKFLAGINPLQFAFDTQLRKGEPLFTGGHGKHNNPSFKLTINSDADCMIFSKTGEERKLSDPRQRTKLSVPSFAVGCDISSGDSGGPAIARDTGLVHGVIWSTKTPKPVRFRSRTFLQDLWQTDSPEIWEHMAYAVSAKSIKERLIRWTQEIRRSRPMRKRRQIVLSLLDLNF